MSWIFVAVSAYFLGAFAVLMDKFLLGSKRISSPQVYTCGEEILLEPKRNLSIKTAKAPKKYALTATKIQDIGIQF